LLAHAVFGYHVLFEYAVWGVPLLLVRRWPVRALVVAAAISAASGSLFSIARASYGVARLGEDTYRAELAQERTSNQEFNRVNHELQQSPEYRTVFVARLRHMAWFYSQPFFVLPVNTFTLFLLGIIALRLGLFERPGEHRLLIAILMTGGIAAWAAAHWLVPHSWQFAAPPVRGLVLACLTSGFGLIREMWLAFAYIGVVLLLVAGTPVWRHWLAAFGWTGRMALTNYIVQVAMLDLLFSNYALGLKLTPLESLGAGLALFAVDAALSRWWLARFRFGPLEWLWRSITYGRMQPWRGADAHATVAAAG
jgi:uncharacterized protein